VAELTTETASICTRDSKNKLADVGFVHIDASFIVILQSSH
jgi:hypothetical protein